MDYYKLEEAIKSDLKTIPTLKMGYVPAKSYYGPIFILMFETSLVFLLINTLVLIGLKALGQYGPALTPHVMLGTWIGCLFAGFLLSFTLRSFLLINQLVKGRLKTEAIIRKGLRNSGIFYLVIYASAYAFLTWVTGLGFERNQDESMFLFITAIIAQGGSYLIALFATTFFSFGEIERLGLGIVFNGLVDLVKSLLKNRNPYIDSRSF